MSSICTVGAKKADTFLRSIMCQNYVPKLLESAAKLNKDDYSSLLFDELKSVYFRPQLFFRAGTLAKLEEQRDEQTRHNITLFQAACSGYLARQAFKKREVGMTSARLHGHPVSCCFLECTCQRRKSGFNGINREGDRQPWHTKYSSMTVTVQYLFYSLKSRIYFPWFT